MRLPHCLHNGLRWRMHECFKHSVGYASNVTRPTRVCGSVCARMGPYVRTCVIACVWMSRGHWIAWPRCDSVDSVAQPLRRFHYLRSFVSAWNLDATVHDKMIFFGIRPHGYWGIGSENRFLIDFKYRILFGLTSRFFWRTPFNDSHHRQDNSHK